MDSINSWINEDEVRKLAEELSESSESIKQWKDKDCDGFAIPERQGQGSDEAFTKDVLKDVRESKSNSLAGASN